MNNEAAQAKLADIERQVKELKEQLAPPGHWRAGKDGLYSYVSWEGKVEETVDDRHRVDNWHYSIGNYYPATTEGRAAAEHAAFLIGFRARWRRSADALPGSRRWLPVKFTKLNYLRYDGADGLPGWSTEEKCRAFVDSEGGPERFAEILARGIL